MVYSCIPDGQPVDVVLNEPVLENNPSIISVVYGWLFAINPAKKSVGIYPVNPVQFANVCWNILFAVDVIRANNPSGSDVIPEQP